MSGFADPIVGGNGNLIRPSVQSPDFKTGVSGWQIRQDGSAEFNNLDVRGIFTGGKFTLDTDGLFLYAS